MITSFVQNSTPSLVCTKSSPSESSTWMLRAHGYSFHSCCFGISVVIKFATNVDKTHWDKRQICAYFTISACMKTRKRSHNEFPLLSPHSMWLEGLLVVQASFCGQNNTDTQRERGYYQCTIFHGQSHDSIKKFLNNFDRDCSLHFESEAWWWN